MEEADFLRIIGEKDSIIESLKSEISSFKLQIDQLNNNMVKLTESITSNNLNARGSKRKFDSSVNADKCEKINKFFKPINNAESVSSNSNANNNMIDEIEMDSTNLKDVISNNTTNAKVLLVLIRKVRPCQFNWPNWIVQLLVMSLI